MDQADKRHWHMKKVYVMNYYELFTQDPEVLIPALLFSLVLTAGIYCIAPLSFALIRKKPITSRRYRWLCLAINGTVKMLLIVFFQSSYSFGACFLWTAVFSFIGIKILRRRGILLSTLNYSEELRQVSTAGDDLDNGTDAS